MTVVTPLCVLVLTTVQVSYPSVRFRGLHYEGPFRKHYELGSVACRSNVRYREHASWQMTNAVIVTVQQEDTIIFVEAIYDDV